MRVSLLDAAGEMEKFLSSELDSSKEIEWIPLKNRKVLMLFLILDCLLRVNLFKGGAMLNARYFKSWLASLKVLVMHSKRTLVSYMIKVS